MTQEVNIFLDSLNSEHTKEQYQMHWDRILTPKTVILLGVRHVDKVALLEQK
jgi:hypothetical protein